MNTYQEIPIDQIEIDKDNPRIANYLTYYDPADVNSDLVLLCLEQKQVLVRVCANL